MNVKVKLQKLYTLHATQVLYAFQHNSIRDD